ncbi:MAG: hypothetical protein M0R68_09920 [Bacteroidetes bacterium]|nr:hypothetical protein [Bacteroidota bacterium]
MKPYSFSLFFLLLIASGCAEKPNSVGNDLPGKEGEFAILYDTIVTTRVATYRTSFSPGTGLSNLAGRIAPGEEAITLLNFIPGGTIDSLDGASIDTVELFMTVNYRYFTVPPPVLFNIVEVKGSWKQSTFMIDAMPGLPLENSVLGTFSDTMKFASRISAQITDTAAIRRWALSYYDTSSSIPDFYGFAVRARTGDTTGMVGFSTFGNSTAYVPSLFIRYTKNGRRDSLTFISGEDTYGIISTVVPALHQLTVRGAFGIRSKVYFNHRLLLDTVNTGTQTILNKAVLELTLDTLASSFGGFSPDTISALLGISDTDLDKSDSTVFAFGLKKNAAAGQLRVYAFDVTKIVDRWVQSTVPNNGITLRWAAEFGTAEKAVFYSRTDSSIVKQPKLLVTYSKK